MVETREDEMMANLRERRVEGREECLPSKGLESGQKEEAMEEDLRMLMQEERQTSAGQESGFVALPANEDSDLAANGITLGEIDALISAASASAEAAQGREAGVS